jgi:ankyrin repeat protein
MKVIALALIFTSLLTTNSLHTTDTTDKKTYNRRDRYILSASYLNGLVKQSEENLEILEQLYEAIETDSSSTLESLISTHPVACTRFLDNYLEKPTRTPLLHLAVVRGNKDIIRILLEHNANINLTDRTFIGNNNTALHYAAQLKKPTRLAICQILINHGAHVDNKNQLGKTPLHLACESSDAPDVPELLIYHKANIHAKTSHGLTPLHIAVTKGYLPIVEFLLACGAKPWYLDYHNKTPMRIAKENRAKEPENQTYQQILTCLDVHNSFEAFVNDLFNFEEPATKRRRVDPSKES